MVAPVFTPSYHFPQLLFFWSSSHRAGLLHKPSKDAGFTLWKPHINCMTGQLVSCVGKGKDGDGLDLKPHYPYSRNHLHS